MNNWPTFTLVHLPNELDDSVPDDVRMAANDLTRQGVPKALLRHCYQADEKITHVL
jgi:O-methyltransferase involved in polyketide biosynthesis